MALHRNSIETSELWGLRALGPVCEQVQEWWEPLKIVWHVSCELQDQV